MIILKAEHIKITHIFDKPRRMFSNVNYEPDIYCLPLNADGMIENIYDMSFFSNISNKNNSVYLFGDCLSGCPDCGTASAGINLPEVPADIKTIRVLSHMYKGKEQGISFNDGVSEVSIRRLDTSSRCLGGTILSIFKGSDFDGSDTIELCRLIRMGDDWGAAFLNKVEYNGNFTDYINSFLINKFK